MKILVAVKQVAALDEDFEFREDGRDVDADFLIRDLNEWDDFALEEAVKIKEAASAPVEVVALSVGPGEADESCASVWRKARTVRFESGTTPSRIPIPIAIARILAAVAKREAPRPCCSPACNRRISRSPRPASPPRRSWTGRMPRS